MDKYTRTILLLSLIGFSITGCYKHKKYVECAELLFGTYQRDSAGDHVILYGLDHETLSRDDSAKYDAIHLSDTSRLAFFFAPTRVLSKEKQELARHLLYETPSELTQAHYKIGCPDCHGQGALFVRMRVEGQVASVLDLDDVPEMSNNIKEFRDKVLEVMKQLEP